MRYARRLWFGFIPVPALILLVGAVYLTSDATLFYEPVWLLPISNTLFVTVVCLLVASIALGNYRATGRVQILLLGCGVLAFGLGAVLAAFLRDVPGSGPNLNVTIHNGGALLGAICHFAAAVILLTGASAEARAERKRLWGILGYGGSAALVGLLTLGSLLGIVPPFFVQGAGPTVLRQVILGSADVLFAFSFIVFLVTFGRNGEAFLFWYSSALALTSISLTAFFIEKSVGSAIGWTGRFSQYVGGAYFLIAILTAMRAAHARRTTLDEVLASSLSPAEEKFRALAENVPDIIRRFDRGLRHIYVNPAGLRFYRAQARSVVGRTIDEVGLSEPDRRLWRERIEKVFATGGGMEVEDHVPTAGGTRFYQSQCVPEFGGDGTVVNVLVVSRDQTEQERAAEVLRAGEARFHSLFTGMTEGFALHEILCDAAGEPVDYRFLEINPAFERLTGLKRDQVVGRLHSEVLPGDDPTWVRTYGKVALSGEPVHFENYSPTLKKHYEVFAYRPAERQFAALFLDVTGRREMEERLRAAHGKLEERVSERTAALQRSNKLLRLLSECNKALVTIDDERELIRAICQVMHEEGGYRMAWVGYAEEDAERTVRPIAHAGFELGYLQRIRISWADNEFGRGPMGTAIREGRVFQARDLLTQAGFAPWKEEALGRGYRSSISLPLFGEGRTFGALAIYSDQASDFDPEHVDLLQELAGDLAYGIVALRGRQQRDLMRRNLEEKAAQLRSLAVESMQAEEVERRRIARILHDELQQLLVGARYVLEPARKAKLEPACREALDRVDATLAEGLEVSRSLTSELSPPVRGSGPVVPVLEWLAIQMKHRHGLSVVVHDAGEAALKNETLLILLYQAVRELLFNVVKHAKVKAARVSVADRSGGVEILVEDEGCGFDVAKMEQSPRSSGGYGLFTIRERLAYLGGRLEVQSAPGTGSRFTLWLPAGTLGEQTDAAPARRGATGVPAPSAAVGDALREAGIAPSRRSGRKIRVLLADDHPVVRRGLALALKDQPDIEVVAEAQTGREAVTLVPRALPDVVIMDMKMPDLGGIEATRIIHAEFPEVRIIGFSALEEAATVASMREAGAVGYVVKSDPPGRLLATIRACFDAPAASS